MRTQEEPGEQGDVGGERGRKGTGLGQAGGCCQCPPVQVEGPRLMVLLLASSSGPGLSLVLPHCPPAAHGAWAFL